MPAVWMAVGKVELNTLVDAPMLLNLNTSPQMPAAMTTDGEPRLGIVSDAPMLLNLNASPQISGPGILFAWNRKGEP